MDYLQKLIQQVRIILFITLLVDNILLFTIWYETQAQWHLPFSVVMALLLFGGLIFTLILALLIGAFIMQPMKLLWRNILHVAPNDHESTAVPKSTMFWLGKDLVANLTGQVYQMAHVIDDIEKTNEHTMPDLHKNFVANSLPLPLIVLDKNETVKFANATALRYFGQTEVDFVGKSLSAALNLMFSDNQTFDDWLAKAKSGTVTATKTWDRVRVPRGNEQDALQFDLSAYYNKNNPEGTETMLICFDHTGQYTKDDQEVGFVALAVHELRTPITLLRGYIEAFDEDLNGKVDAEMQDFMHKMKVASQQLSTFVNNILNVARIEGGQLELQLQQENWAEIVDSVVTNLKLRAEVRGIQVECEIANELPKVGVDRFSISEVITNLIDNAIKYSGDSKKIIVKTDLSKDGLVETTVQDFGVGIAESVVPTLFNKFQRNFHNRAHIAGTGLGLYLSKAIVTAHGGNIWVSSHEGQGTTIGFTILPYDQLADAKKNSNNGDIVHSAHGWIKNHSLYRR